MVYNDNKLDLCDLYNTPDNNIMQIKGFKCTKSESIFDYHAKYIFEMMSKDVYTVQNGKLVMKNTPDTHDHISIDLG